MFNPSYRISGYCLEVIEKIATLTTRINDANITFPIMARLQRETLNRNTHASTSIEGNILSLAEVSAVSENRDVNADLQQKQEVANYIEALRWIIKHRQTAITERKVLHLHRMIVKNLLPSGKAGQYKTKQNYVVNANGVVVYTASSPDQGPRKFRDLIKWVHQKKEIHPIILSAIFHHQCLSIHPFSDGNGRLARAVSEWILYWKGFDPQHILSLDEYYAGDRERYYDKIQQARDLDYDLTYWIDYVTEGILETVEKLYARIRRLSFSATAQIAITPKQEALVEFLSMHGMLNSSELSTLLQVNRARINQLIAPLVKANIVVQEGRARATRYYLNAESKIP